MFQIETTVTDNNLDTVTDWNSSEIYIQNPAQKWGKKSFHCFFFFFLLKTLIKEDDFTSLEGDFYGEAITI